ncbi:MAG: phosphatase PAP2 family protein [Elusimicrobia bacterium]|nr:phosphatase PAP2 family protein [Elusimicrobiota bacterium]
MAPLFLIITLFFLWRQRKKEALLTGSLGLGSWILKEALKRLVKRFRPHLWLWPDPAYGYSFPSGHALGAMVCYGWLAWLLAKSFPQHQTKIFAVSGILIFLIGFSRIYLGVHWPTDVLAGWLLGTLLVISAVYGTRRPDNKNQPKTR